MKNIIINFKEKKLLLAFAFLILLTLLIGLFGIAQIHGLSRKLENLGRYNLKRQSAVLEMRISNAIYAMGIRNYVFWRSSRYLGAVPIAAKVNKIFAAGENFKKQLEIYRQNAYLDQQKDWADQVMASFDEVFALGKKIVQLADKEESAQISEATSSRLMSFENRIYRIDEFLDNSLGKSNLEEVQRQMALARTDKERSIFFLVVSLVTALVAGTLIALAVYRRRIKERLYRQDMFNRMLNLEEDERKHLSNAVHDEMGQDLSALKIYLGLIAQGIASLFPSISHPRESGDQIPASAGMTSPTTETAALQAKVEECKKIAAGLIDKSHNIAFLLRPPDLDEVGLLESIESLLLESKHLGGMEYIFQKPQGRLELAPEYSLLIYRIVQELLTNMVKHAQAKNVELRINKNANSLELFYRDDGQGFDYQKDAQKFSRRKEDKFKLGLIGLKERVEVLDGSMQINSSRGKGMSTSVTLPIL
ncbi:MAG: MCP four helix bundle domain-containing protein [Candidatus Omnitrophica bacterium]|nr:MCP four helix bundle domain-containing protein [Candidatus Omnitrophota bacterium]MBU4302805.1 MCP four helix bundle domain-containing protein [Candidatus Omnitrophota bacterium]MBU4418689.1 MCP four helix bundle domain-containing protein [Candidatus Omnitrophota bacterium]MBU4467721.1 MCP four helix bundle domain-containing protein [Candidatus Omnitrophota bacterium]MCG2708634.1 ATP-binding protein [Candidatus Omnitrophota bacterium]